MAEFWDNPDFVALTGSRLYGTNNPDSDYDYRGFVVPPKDQLIGLPVANFEQKEFEGQDKVIYSLRNWFQHLMRGNTNCLEALFSTDIKSNHIGRMVLRNRQQFVSKQYYRSIRGFANCEFRKARAVKLEINRENNSFAEAIDKLCTTFQLKRFERDSIIDTIQDGRPDLKLKMEVAHVGDLGAKRKASVEQFGYSVKNAYHTIRLLEEGIELMKTGKLTFPRPNADFLKSIRNGEVSMETISILFEELENSLEDAYTHSKLPERANVEDLNSLYVGILNLYIL